MKVLVCGSRLSNHFDGGVAYRELISKRLQQLPPDTHIIHGGATGVDAFANEVAERLGLRVQRFKADWGTHGRMAGPLRNIEMLDQAPNLVIAFWDGQSRGTAHTIREARKLGIPVEVITP